VETSAGATVFAGLLRGEGSGSKSGSRRIIVRGARAVSRGPLHSNSTRNPKAHAHFRPQTLSAFLCAVPRTGPVRTRPDKASIANTLRNRAPHYPRINVLFGNQFSALAGGAFCLPYRWERLNRIRIRAQRRGRLTRAPRPPVTRRLTLNRSARQNLSHNPAPNGISVKSASVPLVVTIRLKRLLRFRAGLFPV